MLSRAVCKKCHRLNKLEWNYIDDESWGNDYVFCPALNVPDTGHWRKISTGLKSEYPYECPYILEHTVNA